MEQEYTFIGPDDLYIDRLGRRFIQKEASTFLPVENKYVEAEERFVQNQITGKDENE